MWASRLTSTGARKYVSLLFMNLMASDGKETPVVPLAAFKPMRVKFYEYMLDCKNCPHQFLYNIIMKPIPTNNSL